MCRSAGGELEFQGRAFPERAADPRQQDFGASLALKARYIVDWDGGGQLFELRALLPLG
jgi:hypothetical protein